MNQSYGTMPAIPQFRKHRKKDYKFKNRLKYIVSSRLARLWNETPSLPTNPNPAGQAISLRILEANSQKENDQNRALCAQCCV